MTASKWGTLASALVLAVLLLALALAWDRIQRDSRLVWPPRNQASSHVPRESIEYIKLHILPYAQSAFCPLDQLEAWNCTTCCRGSAGTKNISTFGGTPFAATGFTAINPNSNTIIIAFRGTNSLDTWISDLLIAKPDYDLPSAPPGTKVHYGFLSLWQTVRVEVIENVIHLLEAHNDSNPRILFTGHSLGGALATIAAVDIFQHLHDRLVPSQVTLLTFGQPRVGNPTFSNWVNAFNFSNTFRVTNQDDWTPHLPPLFSGFKHFHDEMWIATREGDTIVCSDDGGDETGKEGEDEPVCKDRLKWKYDVKKHGWVWDVPIGFHVCVGVTPSPMVPILPSLPTA
ncbi:Alpha/Beta hydrolase protein [Chytriomyces sp. MP71]|nr:Alpha/Beta hydrolase protein [Chytriomyces sp. MP71]